LREVVTCLAALIALKLPEAIASSIMSSVTMVIAATTAMRSNAHAKTVATKRASKAETLGTGECPVVAGVVYVVVCVRGLYLPQEAQIVGSRTFVR
jgi:hypothetical protein